jgi:hypothetical protein
MRRTLWSCRALVCVPVVLAAAGLTGCKSLSERYLAFEVWKYERCFGHLPPGFTPAGAVPPPMAAPAAMRPCSAPCQPCAAADPCSSCGNGMPMVGGMVSSEVGMPQPVRASKPVIISDEVVLP